MIHLAETTGNAISAQITRERHRMGAPATGMVMTLLVLADESCQADATVAATHAAHEHPMRILVLIPRPDSPDARLDADLAVGGADGPGELVALRLRGELHEHAGSVAIPLLLPDTPVVAWWPHQAPAVPAQDPIGSHARRRITNSMGNSDQLAALRQYAQGYRPGDTDLAWTQITNWRSLLASTLDIVQPQCLAAQIHVKRSLAAAHLLSAWLHGRLGIPVEVVPGNGPGITEVRLETDQGDIVVERPDGRTATLHIFDRTPARVALPRRDLGELMSEELRRLTPDEVYGEALSAWAAMSTGPPPSAGPGRDRA